MVGTAVLRLSNCATAAADDMSAAENNMSAAENNMSAAVDGSHSNDNDNNTTSDVTCENEPADIAVTLALLVGVFMVSSQLACYVLKVATVYIANVHIIVIIYETFVCSTYTMFMFTHFR